MNYDFPLLKNLFFYTSGGKLDLKVEFSQLTCKKITSTPQNGTVQVSLHIFSLVALVKKGCNSTFRAHFSVWNTVKSRKQTALEYKPPSSTNRNF